MASVNILGLPPMRGFPKITGAELQLLSSGRGLMRTGSRSPVIDALAIFVGSLDSVLRKRGWFGKRALSRHPGRANSRIFVKTVVAEWARSSR